LREFQETIGRLIVDDGTEPSNTVTMNEGAGLKACLNTRVSAIHQNTSPDSGCLLCFATVDILDDFATAVIGKGKEG
jgi:hypothetical protein